MAEWAVKTVIEKFAQFAALSDNYLKERAGDLRALGQRLLFHLDDANQGPKAAWPERFILVADELSATTLAELPQDRLVGVVVPDGAAQLPRRDPRYVRWGSRP